VNGKFVLEAPFIIFGLVFRTDLDGFQWKKSKLAVEPGILKVTDSRSV
jgi:hypothetical protein